jgi:hypothetical protein
MVVLYLLLVEWLLDCSVSVAIVEWLDGCAISVAIVQ